MAEQLTDGVYKPWMNVNLHSLKIQDVPVFAGGGGGGDVYSLASIDSLSFYVSGSYQLNISTAGGNNFEVVGGNSFKCLVSGLYIISVNIVITAITNSNDPSASPFYSIFYNCLNTTTGKIIQCGDNVLGTSTQRLKNNFNLNGFLSCNVNDIITFNINVNTPINITEFRLNGSGDPNYTSLISFVKIN